MVASIGKIASPSQGVGYFEKDGYYAKDDGAHREASAWAGRGAEALGLSGPVDPERFRSVLEGEVPGGRRLGRREIDGGITHRPGRDVTLSAPKSVSLMAMVGGDERISETLQRYLARHDGIAHGRGTAAGLRKLRAANAKTMLVVDESSLASSEQMRNLLGIATALRLPRVVLVGDERQLGAVEAGKPFAQLRAAGMQMAVMDDILRQRDAELKAAVRASLTGDVKGAFARLGDNIRQVEYGDLGTETARQWLNLPHEQRAATGVIAPTRALRDEINATIREGLIAEGAISGPARRGEKLVARDLTRAQMARASNYAIGDTVIFTRPYKTLGVDKGDERAGSPASTGAGACCALRT